ncbi:hypothetical protein RhiLY_06045 [Ceratobasidium sp. AG-Ba]|nr:hypothetical protein RhiLY_06045 [Ceratobasidium sp. AG-Ba]
MSEDALMKHLERLDSEFTRLKDRFVEIDSTKTTAEVATGVQFLLSLIEAQDSASANLKATSAHILDSGRLQILREQIKSIDLAHRFALQASDTIHRIKVLEMLGSRMEGTTQETPESHVDAEKQSKDSLVADSPVGGSSIIQTDDQMPRPKDHPKVQFAIPTGSAYSDNPPGPSSTTPARSLPSSYPPRRRDSYDIPEAERGRTGAASQAALSTAASHRNNLVSLSAVSFFGAGMAWATVFSGTRGDLVLISWAACCFIVGAISAGSATSLLDADGELLNQYKPVRWTVRLLSVWSMIHVFVGVMLVSTAILVLDPNAEKPAAGMNGGERFGVKNGRAAGGYFLFSALAVVAIAGATYVAAETHKVTFVNKCGKGTPTLVGQNGKIISTGNYTATAPLIARGLLVDGACQSNGTGCTVAEMTLRNGISAADVSIINPFAYQVPVAFNFTNGCSNVGNSCKDASCCSTGGAYCQPTGDDAAVRICTTPDAGLEITFC